MNDKVNNNRTWSSIIVPLGLYTLLWWILSNGSVESLLVGIPCILIATVVSILLIPSTNIVWLEFIKFLPYFFLRSLLGGVDVAWRALHPALPIVPETIIYTSKLPPGLARVFMANTISLLPGTLSAELDGEEITVHVLDSKNDFLSEIRAVEHRLKRVFRVPAE